MSQLTERLLLILYLIVLALLWRLFSQEFVGERHQVEILIYPGASSSHLLAISPSTHI